MKALHEHGPQTRDRRRGRQRGASTRHQQASMPIIDAEAGLRQHDLRQARSALRVLIC